MGESLRTQTAFAQMPTGAHVQTGPGVFAFQGKVEFLNPQYVYSGNVKWMKYENGRVTIFAAPGLKFWPNKSGTEESTVTVFGTPPR